MSAQRQSPSRSSGRDNGRRHIPERPRVPRGTRRSFARWRHDDADSARPQHRHPLPPPPPQCARGAAAACTAWWHHGAAESSHTRRTGLNGRGRPTATPSADRRPRRVVSRRGAVVSKLDGLATSKPCTAGETRACNTRLSSTSSGTSLRVPSGVAAAAAGSVSFQLRKAAGVKPRRPPPPRS